MLLYFDISGPLFQSFCIFKRKGRRLQARKGSSHRTQAAVRPQPSNEQDTSRIGLVSCFLHFPLITNHTKKALA